MQPSPDSRGLGLRSSFLSRPPLGSPALRPGDSLTIPRMALSVSFIRFVSSADATDATELLTPTLVGLTPTEHVSLRWTHYCPNARRAAPSGLSGISVKSLPGSVVADQLPSSTGIPASTPRTIRRSLKTFGRFSLGVPFLVKPST